VPLQLRLVVEPGLALSQMDAVDRTNLHSGEIVRSDARLGDYVGHRLALPAGAGSGFACSMTSQPRLKPRRGRCSPPGTTRHAEGGLVAESEHALVEHTTHFDRLADLHHPPHRGRPGDQVVEPGELHKRAWNGSVSGLPPIRGAGRCLLIPRPSGSATTRTVGLCPVVVRDHRASAPVLGTSGRHRGDPSR
jgi:hypothetical protein